MKLITTQSCHWRRWKAQEDNFLFVDTTLAWGDTTFSPYPELLAAIKKKENPIEWVDYCRLYTLHMRKQYREYPERFKALIHSSKPVVIACACGPNKNCHRHILKGILEKIALSEGVAFTYLGEQTSPEF